MMAKGWKTAYLPEALQYGLIPNSYYGHLKQFLRWVSPSRILESASMLILTKPCRTSVAASSSVIFDFIWIQEGPGSLP
jgi:cellulose synthase/poly-beta-1,6-N-acetylglucosamine synthase-like glycosyltransferase